VSISVVATVMNEADTIDAWLESLLGQSRRPDEVVLVDGGSTDGTVELIHGRADGKVSVYAAPGATISQGRNIAIEHARGDIIAVSDAGTTLDRDWLANLVAPLEGDPAVGVGAGFYLPGGETAFERRLAAIITPHVAEVDPATFLPSSRSVAFRKEWWRRAGGYPEWLRYCEDLVFDMELRRVGARFEFVPAAVATWRARPTLRAFLRQYFRYARGDGHAKLWLGRHLVRYSSYGAGLALLAAGRSRRWPRMLLLALVAAYLGPVVRRVQRHLPPGPDRRAATALVPVVTVGGDVAKMLGYPVGRIERLRAGGPEGLRRATGGARR
jgi:glycosyltransferase involved in cell wall biosynthesis